MPLDDAFPSTLWQVYVQTGIRPEWITPVLFSESGLEPTTVNSIGCAGINQLCSGWLNTIGMTAQQYAALPASQQLIQGVIPYMKDAVARYGPLRSGTRVYQANYLPATLSTARKLTDVIASDPSPTYTQNKGFDQDGKGYIVVQDLANSVARSVGAPVVKSTLDQAYSGPLISASATGAGVDYGPEQDPVYGEDFDRVDNFGVAGVPWSTIGSAVGIALGAVAFAWWLEPRTFRRFFRGL